MWKTMRWRSTVRKLSMAGLAATLALIALFTLSHLWPCGGALGVSLFDGAIALHAPAPRLWWLLQGSAESWLPTQVWYWDYLHGARRVVLVPLWIPLTVVGTATLIGRRATRRPPPRYCLNCSYNLTGNVSGTCPECGAKTGGA